MMIFIEKIATNATRSSQIHSEMYFNYNTFRCVYAKYAG